MSYRRVIPRDLFNEANLLKCYGRLWMVLDQTLGHEAELAQTDDGEPFEIAQNTSDGSLTIRNVQLIARGHEVLLYRPLNSREPWPLYASVPDTEDWEVEVFDDHGFLTDQMRRLIGL